MKTIKSLLVLAAASTLATGCIEEVMPESDTATSEQTGASATALEASLNGIPSQVSQWYYVYGEQTHETDMGYLMFPIAQTEMLGDMYTGEGANTGYDWFSNYNNFARSYGESSYFSYLPWFTLYKLVKSTNDVIGAVSEDSEPNVKNIAGFAYAYRAMFYYTLMTLWEPVENKYTDCSKVLGLTVPIVTDKTTPDEAKTNSRATHEEMVKFILSDLDTAEEYITSAPSSKLQPSKACVYGLKARVYMWDQDYANAAKYARMAIEEHGGKPMTEAQWLDVNTGFNTEVEAWMLKANYSAENMANLCNWTGWMSAEADWGYSSLTKISIDRSLYDKIAYSDFRKYTFLDPNRLANDELYAKYKSCRGQEWLDAMPAYVATKFRCKGGDFETYSVGGVVDVPLMRVEEFYLIDAEATALTEGLQAGVDKLTSFMKQYRQKDYSFSPRDMRDFQLEVLTQMRIESWGEGWAFPAAKRLKPGVIQNYEGTNAPADAFKINCEGIKPNWNLVIPAYEFESNPVLKEQNNPDPTAIVVGPSPVGQYS